ncbi:MAG: sensor histidine kinase, partial [Acidimicrobiales bacterium]
LCLLAETLDGEEDPEVVARLASRVSGEATRLANIIDDLLDLSRIEANEVPESEELPMGAVLDAVLGPLGRLAERKGVALRVDEPDGSLTVLGDRRDLASAVSNLVENAVKFSEPGSEVRVEVIEDGDWLQLSVIDRGVGIPSGDLERIFERFYRVDRARSRSSGGSGLGLSIVRHVASNHGGSVSVTSVEGEGSTFVLTLPLAGRVE